MFIGGIGHNVQIDESVLTRRKYHRGRLVMERWCLGIYDTTTKIGLVQFIPDRQASTLTPIISKYVLPGSEIWTDCWKGYNSLKHLGRVSPYIHKTVNHSRYFRDPITGVCTNQVEGLWSCLKMYLRRLGVMNSPFLEEYIDVFMWRRIFCPEQNATNIFRYLTLHIAERYVF